MAKALPLVAVGFLGQTLDQGTGEERWRRWRPTIHAASIPELPLARFELLVIGEHPALEAQVVRDIGERSPRTKVRVTRLAVRDPWDFAEMYAALDDWARAHAPDRESEDCVVHVTTGTHVAQICLFLLVETKRLPGRLLQTSPPKQLDGGPVGGHALIDLDLSVYDRLKRRGAREQREHQAFLKSGIRTRNKAFNLLIERIERVALASDAPMLLTGPTGAGKSQLARQIHLLRKREGRLAGAFVDVNCATLRGDGAMSALFGHVKGAFTGAAADRAGLLRSADGGLLFLDEIGELGLDEQAMLLRAIEEKTFLPVGSDKEARSGFQLVAGTNRDLDAEVRAGRFREDLLARINLWTFRLPALAERREDLEPNLDWELERWEEARGRRVSINKEARQRFLAFATSPQARWPGNFRDFNASLVRMATLAPAGRIDVATVDEEIARLREAWQASSTVDTGSAALEELLGPSARELDRFDAVQLADVVAACRASRSLSEAGRVLYAASRARKGSVNDADRLRKYLAKFGLEFERVRGA
jgi:transcriptional regulatory protein RtcR